jgi:cation transport ATPase
MPRVNWMFFILALVGVGGGAALWIAQAIDAAHLVWTATTVAAFLPLVVQGIRSLRRREPGIDIIAVLAMAGTLVLDAALAGAVIGLMLASGQVLERYATARARRELLHLLERAPRVAHRWHDGTLTTVAVEAVEPGDVLLVKEADVVPVDGVVLEGTASIDASTFTGEARPVASRRGRRDTVLGIFCPLLNKKGLCAHDIALHVGSMTQEDTDDSMEAMQDNPCFLML